MAATHRLVSEFYPCIRGISFISFRLSACALIINKRSLLRIEIYFCTSGEIARSMYIQKIYILIKDVED